jgi:hypothetical protein
MLMVPVNCIVDRVIFANYDINYEIRIVLETSYGKIVFFIHDNYGVWRYYRVGCLFRVCFFCKALEF